MAISMHRPDPESRAKADARRALVSMRKDAAQEDEDALVNFTAYFYLSDGPKPRDETLERLYLSLGMKVVSPGDIRRKAEKLAEELRGTIVEKAVRNGDSATALALMKRKNDQDKAFDKLISSAAAEGGRLTHLGVNKLNSLIQRRVDQKMRSFTAASLADMKRERSFDPLLVIAYPLMLINGLCAFLLMCAFNVCIAIAKTFKGETVK